MSRFALPASPLSTWDANERSHHATIVASRAIAADRTSSADMREAARGIARDNLALLNASLRAGGKRSGYRVTP